MYQSYEIHVISTGVSRCAPVGHLTHTNTKIGRRSDPTFDLPRVASHYSMSAIKQQQLNHNSYKQVSIANTMARTSSSASGRAWLAAAAPSGNNGAAGNTGNNASAGDATSRDATGSPAKKTPVEKAKEKNG